MDFVVKMLFTQQVFHLQYLFLFRLLLLLQIIISDQTSAWCRLEPIKLDLLTANLAKWSNTLKQFVGFCRRVVSVFDHFLGLTLKVLNGKYSNSSSWVNLRCEVPP